jgi:hypothetical protein
MINVYNVKDKSGDKKIMCCVSNSPYIKKNCNGFESKEKTKQTKLF